MSPDCHGFILLEPGLDTVGDQEVTVGFKTINFNVCLGISFRETLERVNFKCGAS